MKDHPLFPSAAKEYHLCLRSNALRGEESMFLKTLGLVLAIFCASMNLHADDDLFVGVWKVNLAKSKYSPDPPPQSSVVTTESSGSNGIKVVVNTINAQGNKITNAYTANYDGKEYPFVQTGAGAVSGQTVTLKRINSHTVDRNTYLAGKIFVAETWVLSKDGKTRTVTQTGTNAKGQAIHNVIVQDRQ
jgi:hypothetical protein